MFGVAEDLVCRGAKLLGMGRYMLDAVDQPAGDLIGLLHQLPQLVLVPHTVGKAQHRFDFILLVLDRNEYRVKRNTEQLLREMGIGFALVSR
ncbi:hypothetical protein D3C73_1087360 [compost metagenome]